jgi:hypothetical protein
LAAAGARIRTGESLGYAPLPPELVDREFATLCRIRVH